MNALNKLLDKSAELCGSDLASAARLKVTRSAVSKWRHGGKISPEQLARLVDLTQQDPAVAVQVLQEQEATEAERKMWGALWDRLSPATTLVVGALLVVGLGNYLTTATVDIQAFAAFPFVGIVHYAKLALVVTAGVLAWAAVSHKDAAHAHTLA